MIKFLNDILKRHILNLVGTQKGVDALYCLLQVLETIGVPSRMIAGYRRGLILASQTSGRLPSSFTSKHVLVVPDEPPLGVGAFATVYRGVYYGSEVAVKRSHLSCRTLQKTKQRFIKETLIMNSLHHPNILPFLGVIYSESEVSIISPIMECGHLRAYLLRVPSAPKRELVTQVARGLQYLERCNIVHGDLKGVNILVDSNGNVRIADFGLANYCSDETAPPLRQYLPDLLSQFTGGSKLFNNTGLVSTESDAGTSRWMSPERLFPLDGETTSARATFAADIFAFAMVIYEIYSGRIPFHRLNNMMATIAITKGQRPEREFEIPDDLWELTCLCWKGSSQDRPHIEQVIHRLSATLAQSSPSNLE